jgi:predicted outer membrane repeat protein
VTGRLLAMGTITDSIFFTTANTTTGWYGIRIDNTPSTNDTSKIIYCNIQWGNANGSGNDANGGACIINNFSKVIISNCLIKNNSANKGGGIYFIDSNPKISDNSISDNSANYGGGIYCYNSNPLISHNSISNNTATSGGGGGILCSNNSNPLISDNVFSNNSAISGGGGGIYCSDASPTISNNNFTGNSAYVNAGAIYADVGCNSAIFNNTISYNSCAYGSGGGITCNMGNATVYNNMISNNSAQFGGGIGSSINNGPAIYNNIISNNSSMDALNGGGGVYCYASNAILTNNTIVNNSTMGNGGALYCANSSNLTIRNCILYNNTAVISGEQVFLYDELSDPDFYYCDVQDSSTAFGLNGNFYTGIYQNNINADPLFNSPSGGSRTGYNGITADWSLQSTSPCIDVGDPSSTYPAADITGNPRVVGNYIDIGAYEYQVTGIADYYLQNQIIIYPNPFNNSATIQLITNVKYSELNLYNMSGQKIKTINDISGDQIKIERENLSSGFYFYELKQDKKIISTGKLIITE